MARDSLRRPKRGLKAKPDVQGLIPDSPRRGGSLAKQTGRTSVRPQARPGKEKPSRAQVTLGFVPPS